MTIPHRRIAQALLAAALTATAVASRAGAQPVLVQPTASMLPAQPTPTVTMPSGETRSAPAAVPIARTIPDAADTPYPGGAISLDIDATDVTRNVWRVTETVPLAPGTQGDFVLLLPQWLPGTHSASGQISQLVDIRFHADGALIPWHRDPLEVFAFHLDVPPGARTITATFLDTSPLQPSEGRATMTREMANLQWDAVSLYPSGHYVRQIRFRPTVLFPAGWGVASALDGRRESDTPAGKKVTWAEVDYEALVDSPVFAGAHFRRFDLGHDVALDVVADRPEYLELKPDHLASYKALVDEAMLAFGGRHFNHYDFLLALSDRLGGIGLEHHRSSENSMKPKALVDWDDLDWARNVLAHEFSHSWDGKFRRPARLWTPDYRQPMVDDLLWVYEGQTQFWGLVLAARSGVQKPEMILGEMANYAGQFTQWPGREWRSVSDTTLDPIIATRRPKPFPSLDRNEDYYTEGALIWLEADQIIRAGTHGQKGLDDFARRFFGIRDGDWGEVTYTFADVVSDLDAVYPYDWAGFLKARIETPGRPAPLAGIERGGYRLVWRDEPNPYDKARMADAKAISLFHSLGIVIDKDARVTAARWGSVAARAGVVSGEKIIAVNGSAYDQDVIKAAISAARNSNQTVDLLVQRDDRFTTISLPYHDGLRWPWLERVGSAPAPLDLLLKGRRAGVR